METLIDDPPRTQIQDKRVKKETDDSPKKDTKSPSRRREKSVGKEKKDSNIRIKTGNEHPERLEKKKIMTESPVKRKTVSRTHSPSQPQEKIKIKETSPARYLVIHSNDDLRKPREDIARDTIGLPETNLTDSRVADSSRSRESLVKDTKKKSMDDLRKSKEDIMRDAIGSPAKNLTVRGSREDIVNDVTKKSVGSLQRSQEDIERDTFSSSTKNLPGRRAPDSLGSREDIVTYISGSPSKTVKNRTPDSSGSRENIVKDTSPAKSLQFPETDSPRCEDNAVDVPSVEDSAQDGDSVDLSSAEGGLGGDGDGGFEDNDLNPETHTLSDFKELCKSVASLLHIEDGAAAAMLSEPLSGRKDLVEGLDAEAIFDYLATHRVLDEDAVQSLRGMPSVAKRNKALLHHVEREGPNAVALFINALRQSGQLHLASSLDNTQRIKPMTGSGYWEKQRHKGQVTIAIKVRALRIVVPERDSDGDVIDASMLASPAKRLNQSYENMLMLDSPDGANKSIRIMDYPYSDEDDDEKMPKKRSFFCFCFPRAAKKKKAKEKYLEQQQQKHSKANSKSAEDSSREVNGSGVSKSERLHSPEHTIPDRTAGQPNTVDPGEVNFRSDSRRNSGSPRKEFSVDKTDRKNSVNERKSGGKKDKENADPVIMEYNKKMELVRLKAQRHRDRSELKSDSSAIVMCEKWKSDGQYFRKKVAAFCQQFDFDLQTYIIKYFEQDRGTLVLSVWTDGTGMYVSNICLTAEQVRQLQKDHSSGVLLERLDALLQSNNCLEKLDIKDIDLAVVIEDEQFEQALCDLS